MSPRAPTLAHPLAPEIEVSVATDLASATAAVRRLPDGAFVTAPARIRPIDPSVPGDPRRVVVVQVPPPVPPAAPSLDPQFLPMELALTILDAAGRSIVLDPVRFRWGVEPPVLGADPGPGVLALSRAGEPIVAASSGGLVETFRWKESAWTALPPLSGKAPIGGLSLAAGEDSIVLASVDEGDDGAAGLRVHRHRNGAWEALESRPAGSSPLDTSSARVALDADGRPVLALHEREDLDEWSTRERLRLLRHDGERWLEPTRALAGEGEGTSCFSDPAVALGATAEVILAYQDAACIPVYAQIDPGGGQYHVRAWTSGALRDVGEPIRSSGGPAREPALASTASGLLVHAESNVFRWEGDRWVDLGVPAPGEEFGEIGGDFSCGHIAALPDGSPVVACEIREGSDLRMRLRRHDGTRWVDVPGFEHVEFSRISWWGPPRLAVDPQGRVVLLTDEGYVVRRPVTGAGSAGP